MKTVELRSMGGGGKTAMHHALSNPHMWIPYQGPEPYDEVCPLCGTFSGAHHKRPDPPAAAMPCPEPWPHWDDKGDTSTGRP
jgi:hypothetical protein